MWYLAPSDTVSTMVSRVPLLFVVLFLFAAACAQDPQATSGSTFDAVASRQLPTSPVTGQSVGALSLPDVSNDGTPFFFHSADGEMLVVYFGFTSCPDICPTTLADLKAALAAMGDDADRVEVAMVTIDPDRDSAEALVDYVQWFIPAAHALRTEDRSLLEEAGDAFGAEFSIVKTPASDVEVLHTAYLYAVDDMGVVVAIWPFGVDAERIASDISSLLAR